MRATRTSVKAIKLLHWRLAIETDPNEYYGLFPMFKKYFRSHGSTGGQCLICASCIGTENSKSQGFSFYDHHPKLDENLV